MTAGGKKAKDETPTRSQTTAPAQQSQPAPQQTVNLSKSSHEQKEKKKGCCWLDNFIKAVN